MFLKVYTADVSPLYDENTYSYYYEKSIPYRKKKADCFKPQKSKCLSIGAGILLKKALTDVGIPKNLWEFKTTEDGRTELADAAELMIDFNLSHSGNKVMCVISDMRVGCDVEEIKENSGVARRFFTKTEAELATDNPLMFTRIWTLKESFIKTTGEGLKRPLNSFRICFDEDLSKVTGVEGDGIAEGMYSFYEWDKGDGYRYSACVEGIGLTPEIERVEFGSVQG